MTEDKSGARPANSLMQTMREATHDIHASLEKKLRIALPGAGGSAYVAYASALWGWLAPVESRLWQGNWPARLHPQGRAQKRLWLEADLRHAGIGDAELAGMAARAQLPAFSSMAERYGWAYVIEGAQLGGQVLRKTLAPALHPWQPRWLEGYGGETGKNWKEFTGYLDSLDDPLVVAPARQAACDAFGALSAWFDEQGACI